MKKFRFYDDHEGQFIDKNLDAKLRDMRPTVVQGMIGLRKVNEFLSKKAILFLYMKDPQNNEASVFEVSAGFYTEQFRKNIRYAIRLARDLVYSVNHWEKNKCVRVHSVNRKYKSIPSEVAYEPTENIMNVVSAGCQKTKREDIQILRMPIKTRRKMAAKLEQSELMKAENRKRNSR